MKSIILLLFLSVTASTLCQNTEVYLFDISNSNGKLSLTDQRNISNNEGYDNQPSFYNDNLVTFASTLNNQTDITTFNIRDNKISYMNSTAGSEYSPLKIPNSKNISAVRLNKDGKQRLYSYDFRTGKSKELVKDLVVAYYTWYNKYTIVSAVIEDDTLNLYVIDVKSGDAKKYASNVGRSFHTIPNSKLISFVSKKDKEQWTLNSLNPETGEIRELFPLPKSVEDVCWLINGSVLIPVKNTVYAFNPKEDKIFNVFAKFDDDNLQNITRIATNEIGTMLALVSEVSPELIVQKQLDAYNKRDIDAFMATYSKNIKIYNFPNDLRTDGHEAMRKTYKRFFENTPDLNCKILKRIINGNKVIDHELVTANGNTFKAVAIYEVENGLINKVTFVK